MSNLDEKTEQRVDAYSEINRLAKAMIFLLDKDKYLKLSDDTNDRLSDYLQYNKWVKANKLPPDSKVPYNLLCVVENGGEFNVIETRAWIRDSKWNFCSEDMKLFLKDDNVMYWCKKTAWPDRKEKIIEDYKNRKM